MRFLEWLEEQRRKFEEGASGDPIWDESAFKQHEAVIAEVERRTIAQGTYVDGSVGLNSVGLRFEEFPLDEYGEFEINTGDRILILRDD